MLAGTILILAGLALGAASCFYVAGSVDEFFDWEEIEAATRARAGSGLQSSRLERRHSRTEAIARSHGEGPTP